VLKRARYPREMLGLPERGGAGGVEDKISTGLGFYWLVRLYRAIR
jgi:hypothetical protein